MTVREMLFGTTSRIYLGPETGTGDGSPPPNEGGEQVPAWAKELQDAFKGVGAGMTELVNLAKRAQQPPPQQTEEEEEEEEVEEGDLELMPRAQFIDHMTKKILQAVNEQVVKPLSSKMQGIATVTEQRTIQEQVAKVAEKNPDVYEWKEELVALSQQHPTLSVAQLYKLARDDDPDKASKMDQKYKKNESDDKDQERKIKLSFGGLTPTGSSGSRSAENRKMSPKEAADAAWEETVKSMGAEPMFEE